MKYKQGVGLVFYFFCTVLSLRDWVEQVTMNPALSYALVWYLVRPETRISEVRKNAISIS